MEYEVIGDFLPSPDKLILKDESIKVTMNLNRSSIDFFKNKAKIEGVSYQQMIRKVLDLYADHYAKN